MLPEDCPQLFGSVDNKILCLQLFGIADSSGFLDNKIPEASLFSYGGPRAGGRARLERLLSELLGAGAAGAGRVGGRIEELDASSEFDFPKEEELGADILVEPPDFFPQGAGLLPSFPEKFTDFPQEPFFLPPPFFPPDAVVVVGANGSSALCLPSRGMGGVATASGGPRSRFRCCNHA